MLRATLNISQWLFEMLASSACDESIAAARFVNERLRFHALRSAISIRQ